MLRISTILESWGDSENAAKTWIDSQKSKIKSIDIHEDLEYQAI